MFVGFTALHRQLRYISVRGFDVNGEVKKKKKHQHINIVVA